MTLDSFQCNWSQDLQKYVLVGWALTKDWGAKAIRFGWLTTHNQAVLDALAISNVGHSSVPLAVQEAVAAVLRNTSAVEGLLNRSASRMHQTYTMVAGALGLFVFGLCVTVARFGCGPAYNSPHFRQPDRHGHSVYDWTRWPVYLA